MRSEQPQSTADAAVDVDPLVGDPRLAEVFGDALPAVQSFRDLLADQGVLRGLVGPREVSRLWERHLVNSAAVVPFLPTDGVIVDVGSGAGLPGIVVSAMRPDASVVLVEPMERRTDWLREIVDALALANVEIRRGRADEVGITSADAVTARAVAALDKLYGWTLPLLRVGGRLVALKGGRAAAEVDAAAQEGQRLGGGGAEIATAPTMAGLEPTTVVLVTKERPGPATPPVPRETTAAPRARRRTTKGRRS